MTAFRATYSDWKVIKGRKVVQVIFELPLEAADSAYQVLGGMPIAASEVWCGIARLNSLPQRPPAVEAATRPVTSGMEAPAGADKRKSPAQIAGYLCTLPSFQKFLQKRHYEVWMRCDDLNDQRRSANVVRQLCDVESRSEITEDNAEWSALRLAFMLWEKEAEVLPA